VEETFFNLPIKFESFSDFETKILKVSHTNHTLDDKVYKLGKQRFEQHLSDEGAHFLMPIRGVPSLPVLAIAGNLRLH
jgi:hypothetical protein